MKKFKINTNKKDYKAYNGKECVLFSCCREDGLIEVYLPELDILILLESRELEEAE